MGQLDQYDLSGRVAVITGAASGIGRASALALADVGATVVCADVALDGAQVTAKEIEAAGGTALAVACDVTKSDSVDALIASAVDAFGRVDIMGNIAGIMLEGLVAEMDDDALEKILAINLKGVFYGCRAAARAMAAQGSGSIINMSSGAIDTPAPKLAGYAMAKAGVAMLTKTLATELAKGGVRVNAIAPGFVMTAMTARHFTNADGTVDEEKKKGVEQVMGKIAPLGRVGAPEDIASSVVFLASDASSFMTGQILRPNGGVSMPW